MTEDEAKDIIRLACAALTPGLAQDASPGAPEIEAERFVLHYLEAGEVSSAAEAIEQASGGNFAGLDQSSQVRALAVAASEQPVVLRIHSLVLSAVYGSWSGTSEHRPLGWDLADYPGPSRHRSELGT